MTLSTASVSYGLRSVMVLLSLGLFLCNLALSVVCDVGFARAICWIALGLSAVLSILSFFVGKRGIEAVRKPTEAEIALYLAKDRKSRL